MNNFNRIHWICLPLCRRGLLHIHLKGQTKIRYVHYLLSLPFWPDWGGVMGCLCFRIPLTSSINSPQMWCMWCSSYIPSCLRLQIGGLVVQWHNGVHTKCFQQPGCNRVRGCADWAVSERGWWFIRCLCSYCWSECAGFVTHSDCSTVWCSCCWHWRSVI